MGSCKCGCLFICTVGYGDGSGAKDLSADNGSHCGPAGAYDKRIRRLEAGFTDSTHNAVYIRVVAVQKAVRGLYHKVYGTALPCSVGQHINRPEGILLVWSGHVDAVIIGQKTRPGFIEGGIYEVIGVSAFISRSEEAGTEGTRYRMADKRKAFHLRRKVWWM